MKTATTAREKTNSECLLYRREIGGKQHYDEEATESILEARLSEVQPVEVTVRPGQIVVQRGTTVTEEQVEMLNKTGLAEHDKNFLYYPGIFLYVLCLYFLIYIYCRRFFPYYAYDNHGIRFLGAFLVGFLILCQTIMVVTYSMNGTLYSVLGIFCLCRFGHCFNYHD